MADHLVQANLAGHDSHGVGMIPSYMASLAEGKLQLNVHAQVVRDAGAVLTVDGGQGFGQVVAREAMDKGIERARQLGLAAVALHNSHHIGASAIGPSSVRAGFISIHFVNVVGDPMVAPFGGSDRRFGTNPFCVIFPREGQKPLLLDFATSGMIEVPGEWEEANREARLQRGIPIDDNTWRQICAVAKQVGMPENELDGYRAQALPV